MTGLRSISRVEKLDIAKGIHLRLLARLAANGPEPALDGFIAPLEALTKRLEGHVSGDASASAASTSLLSRLDVADDEVDTLLRHVENYLLVEGRRRSGVYVIAARNLHDNAFPQGVSCVDARISEENAYCKRAIEVLRSPEHEATIKGIKLPLSWIDAFEVAVDKSDALNNELLNSRGDKSEHVRFARAVENEWVNLMRRLRNHIASRADASDLQKKQEGERLLEPLLLALKKLSADAAARATRRKKNAEAKVQESQSG